MALMKMKYKSCRTEGERLVYSFFRDYLADEYTIWSNVELMVFGGNRNSSTEMDFILYLDEIGLMIFSVKDWRINQIEHIDSENIIVNKKKFRNPYSSLRRQKYTLMERLQKKNELVDLFQRFPVPINEAIIFPFIEKEEWLNKLKDLHISDAQDIRLPAELILFKSHFSKDSLLTDKNRSKHYFQNLRTFRLSGRFDNRQIDVLDSVFGVVEEETRVERIPIDVEVGDTLVRLDQEQIKTANKYIKEMYNNPGHLIIKGTAGSGKTIILLHIFSQIARDPDKKILYVGRQRELVEDFKKGLLKKGIDVEDNNYFIDTFHQFLEKFCGAINYKNIERGERGYPTEEAISKYIEDNISKTKEIYDFAFIDEGHNLPDSWIKLLVYCTKGKKKGNIIYVEDFEQNIYKVKRDLRKASLVPRNETIELLVNYRNTYEITYFSYQLTNKYKHLLKDKNMLKLRKGPIPSVILAQDYKSGSDKIFKKFCNWIEEGFKVDEITAIYPNVDTDPEGLFMNFMRIFRKNDYKFSLHYSTYIINNMFGEDYLDVILSRREDPESCKNTINLITSFSSQGMSYKCVILFMDNFEDEKWKYFKRNLAYISLTRATHNLVLVFSKETDTYNKAKDIAEVMRASSQ